MPVAPRPTPPAQNDDVRLLALLRTILKEARGNYIVWGRLMQGPSGVDCLILSEMANLATIIKRYKSE